MQLKDLGCSFWVIPATLLCFAMAFLPVASSNAGGVDHDTLVDSFESRVRGTPVMSYSTSSTNRYQLARTTDTVHQHTCIYSTLGWSRNLHNASICLPIPSAQSSLSEMYKRFQDVLVDKAAFMEASLRITFRFGAFVLLISALEPIFSWQMFNAVAAVLAALLSCAMCITLCAFTMVVVLATYCGRWLAELVWAGRGQVDAIVG